MAKLGEFLKQSDKNKGAMGGGKKEKSRGAFSELRDDTPTLADLGIDRKESALSQKLYDNMKAYSKI